MTNNDTSTLNGALQELGETMAENLTTMGVPSTYDEGLTTLAGKILEIAPVPPTPTPASITLSCDKPIMMTGETATLTATVLDENDNPCEGETVSFEVVNGESLGSDVTDENGEASVYYLGEGTGDLNIKAYCGILSSEIFVVEDCSFFDECSETGMSKYTMMGGYSHNLVWDSTNNCYRYNANGNSQRPLWIGALNMSSNVKMEGDFKIIQTGSHSNYDAHIGFGFGAYDSTNDAYSNLCGSAIVCCVRHNYLGYTGAFTNTTYVHSIIPETSSSEFGTGRAVSNKWYHIEWIIDGTTSTCNIYDGDTLLATKTITITQYPSTNNRPFIYAYLNTSEWSRRSDGEFKNIKIKPL